MLQLYRRQRWILPAGLPFKQVLLAGHIGKLVKLAGGVMNTHSKYADARTELFLRPRGGVWGRFQHLPCPAVGRHLGRLSGTAGQRTAEETCDGQPAD